MMINETDKGEIPEDRSRFNFGALPEKAGAKCELGFLVLLFFLISITQIDVSNK